MQKVRYITVTFGEQKGDTSLGVLLIAGSIHWETSTHFCELIKITLQLLFKQQTTKRRSLMRLGGENFMDILILRTLKRRHEIKTGYLADK